MHSVPSPRLSNDELSVIASFISPSIMQRVDVLNLRASCQFFYTSEPFHELILRCFVSRLSDFLQNHQPLHGIKWREQIQYLNSEHNKRIALDSSVPCIPKHFQSQNIRLRFGVFGVQGAGKHTLVIKDVTDFFITDRAPIEDVYHRQTVVDGTRVIYESWPVYEEIITYSTMFEQYCKGSDVIVMVYHMNSPEGFKSSVQGLQQMLEKIQNIRDVDCIERLPIVIARTMCDLDTFNARYWLQQIPDCKELLDYVENLPFPRIDTSAVTGENVSRVFECAARVYVRERALIKTKKTLGCKLM